MKKSFLTVLFALFCTMGFAQLSFNVKAGLNLSSYIGENSDHSKFKPGARIGVGMEYLFVAEKEIGKVYKVVLVLTKDDQSAEEVTVLLNEKGESVE